MTIPMLPYSYANNDETTFRGLHDIATALAQIVQPYKQTELGLQGLIAKNPEIAQKLADQEYLNPGSLKQAFGPNAGKYFSDMQPSAEAVAQKSIREEVPNVVGKTPEDLINSGAPLSRIAAARVVTGATPGALEGQEYSGLVNSLLSQEVLNNTPLGQQIRARKGAGLTTGGVARAESETQTYDPDTVASVLNAKDPVGMYLKGVSGQDGGFDARQINTLTALPIWNALKQTLGQRVEEEKMALRMKLGTMKIDASQADKQDVLQRMLIMNSISTSQRTGVPAAAVLAINLGADNPLVQKMGGVTPEQLQQAQQMMEQSGTYFGARGMGSAVNNINKLMQTYFKAKASGVKPEGLAPIVDAMNTAGSAYGLNYVYNKDQGLLGYDPNGQLQTEDQLKFKIMGSGPVTGTRQSPINAPPSTAQVGAPGQPGGGGSAGGQSSKIGVKIPGFDIDGFVGAYKNASPEVKQKMLNDLNTRNHKVFAQVRTVLSTMGLTGPVQ